MTDSTVAEKPQMQVICLVSSLLQKVVFLTSRHAMRPHLLVGNRGIAGDVTYKRSVLNDFQFLEDFNALVDRQSGTVEVFLPNALNTLYYYALSHPRVARISFVDEGVLTSRFVDGGYQKPAAPFLRAFTTAFGLARHLPDRSRAFSYRAIARIIKRAVGVRYESDTLNYPLRTIELSRKGGVVISHIAPVEPLPWVEHVDLTRDVMVERDYDGAACLFVHPKQVAQPDQVEVLCARIVAVSDQFTRGLIKPHPLFTEFPGRLEALRARLAALGMHWTTIDVSGQYEPSIELYARGVRIFIVGKSSVTVTVARHPDYFTDLTLVEI